MLDSYEKQVTTDCHKI